MVVASSPIRSNRILRSAASGSDSTRQSSLRAGCGRNFGQRFGRKGIGLPLRGTASTCLPMGKRSGGCDNAYRVPPEVRFVYQTAPKRGRFPLLLMPSSTRIQANRTSGGKNCTSGHAPISYFRVHPWLFRPGMLGARSPQAAIQIHTHGLLGALHRCGKPVQYFRSLFAYPYEHTPSPPPRPDELPVSGALDCPLSRGRLQDGALGGPVLRLRDSRPGARDPRARRGAGGDLRGLARGLLPTLRQQSPYSDSP
jgi:hypothetical protein